MKQRLMREQQRKEQKGVIAEVWSRFSKFSCIFRKPQIAVQWIALSYFQTIGNRNVNLSGLYNT